MDQVIFEYLCPTGVWPTLFVPFANFSTYINGPRRSRCVTPMMILPPLALRLQEAEDFFKSDNFFIMEK